MWTVVIEFIIQLKPSSTKGHKPHCDFLCIPAQPSEVTHISKGRGILTATKCVACEVWPRYHQEAKAVADVTARDQGGTTSRSQPPHILHTEA